MSTGFGHADSTSRKLVRAPANALLLTLAFGPAAALNAQSAEQLPEGTYSLLYSFQCHPDGAYPEAGLVRDSAGNLYGTTFNGGSYDYGTVFKVTPGGTESLLYSFAGYPADGSLPQYGSLTLDAAGNAYGTTSSGGEFANGTVFKVTATGTESVLYSFTGGSDGRLPEGGLARDSAGGLYGTTAAGGTYGQGVVFKLTRGTESVLHSFGSSATDGEGPSGNLTRDWSGDLYGTTEDGGVSSDGTVFELSASSGARSLYSFKGGPADGANPGGLLRDTSGNLYGVTQYGGTYGYGTVFKLTAAGTESVLLNFSGTAGGGPGKYPIDGLAMDAAGNLYGTTTGGGSTACGSYGCGVLFGLTTAGKEKVLHEFSLSSSSDGAIPQGGVVRDPLGNFYGTLSAGGAYGCGAVFKYTP